MWLGYGSTLDSAEKDLVSGILTLVNWFKDVSFDDITILVQCVWSIIYDAQVSECLSPCLCLI